MEKQNTIQIQLQIRLSSVNPGVNHNHNNDTHFNVGTVDYYSREKSADYWETVTQDKIGTPRRVSLILSEINA